MQNARYFEKGEGVATTFTKKVGDETFIYYSRSVIADVTDLHYVTESGARFQKRDLWLVGDHSETTRLEPWSEKAEEGLKKQIKVLALRNNLEYLFSLHVNKPESVLDDALQTTDELVRRLNPPQPQKEELPLEQSAEDQADPPSKG